MINAGRRRAKSQVILNRRRERGASRCGAAAKLRAFEEVESVDLSSAIRADGNRPRVPQEEEQTEQTHNTPLKDESGVIELPDTGLDGDGCLKGSTFLSFSMFVHLSSAEMRRLLRYKSMGQAILLKSSRTSRNFEAHEVFHFLHIKSPMPSCFL